MLPILSLAGACLLFLAYRYFSKPSRLPPGPKGYPLLGNALDIPLQGLFLKLHEWRQDHGDIFALNAAGQKMLVLTKASVAADIMDRMSAVSSDRPSFVMMGEIMTGNLMISSLPHGDKWRRMRRIIHEGFNIRASEAYYTLQEEEASQLVCALIRDPNGKLDVGVYLQRVAASVIWRSLYDAPSLFESHQVEERVDHMNEILDALLNAAMPLAYFVDLFPAMKYIPTWAAKWKKYGVEFFNSTDRFFEGLFEEGRQQKGEGGRAIGFAASSEDACKTFGVSTREAAWTAGTLFGAGAETTVAAMHYFVMAMLLYPDVARKAQDEIDSVVGGRPPTFGDRQQLPYIQALVKETLRWRSPVPAGIPHVVTEEYTYKDYVIPKGTMIIGNVWSMNRDPTMFPDYDNFRPERYLDEKTGKVKAPMADYHDDVLAYGYGRRICPGRDFANNTLFIEIAYLLWAFDIVRAKDERGQEIIPNSMKFADKGLTAHPAPFKCVFQPRQANLLDLLPCA